MRVFFEILAPRILMIHFWIFYLFFIWGSILEAIRLVLGSTFRTLGSQKVTKLQSQIDANIGIKQTLVLRRHGCDICLRANDQDGRKGGGKPTPWKVGGMGERKHGRKKERKNGRFEDLKKEKGLHALTRWVGGLQKYLNIILIKQSLFFTAASEPGVERWAPFVLACTTTPLARSAVWVPRFGAIAECQPPELSGRLVAKLSTLTNHALPPPVKATLEMELTKAAALHEWLQARHATGAGPPGSTST